MMQGGLIDLGGSGRILAAAAGVIALVSPFLVPALSTQLTFLWVMIVFALTWDIMGGQMGYNSFGNVLFFGLGMYACAVVQRDSGLGYLPALLVGLAASAAIATVVATILGAGLLGLRGQYFAIGTLGLGIAAGEIASSWEYVGAGGGMTVPLYPGDIEFRKTFFYFLCLSLAVVNFVTLSRLYQTRFGLALNAIRDDEDKAESMGLHTTRYKTVAWCISAFFLGVAGGLVGNIIGFVDPRDIAFASTTYGVWMVLMAILGGKGTLWGPVIGAVVFHTTQELFWIYVLNWQRVALGLLIVIIVVFFPQGILGWAREQWPSRFGVVVDEGTRRIHMAGDT
jgi:branched-chain amino acid transport system permease protein